MENWTELHQCKNESRRELVLKGNEDLRKKVKNLNGELPSGLYELSLLNFLETSSMNVETLSSSIENLKNLTQLFLMKNKLTKLPDTVCKLKELKYLDVAENSLLHLPDEIGNLNKLHTLNLANNKLSHLPKSVSSLESLAVLNISQNNFDKFPVDLYSKPICLRLADLNASHNNIDDIHDSIEGMIMLKSIDMSDNKIVELTQAIGKCLKLKQTSFKSNPLKDKRLKKLVEQNNSQKAVLDYVRTKGRKIGAINHDSGEKKQGKGGETRKKLKNQRAKAAEEKEEKAFAKYFLQVLKVDDDEGIRQPFRIIVSDDVKDVRPFVVGCVIKHLDVESEQQFKSFITLQTKLHENICQKRTVATIATHDAKLIPDSLVSYGAADPTLFSIRPLGRHSDVTALAFYQRLCKEADDVRKEKKRNQVSGIHKYLNLLKDKDKFPFLRRSSDDCVISLPPLSNSEVTKITRGVLDVFIEVTGNKSLNVCKAVMDDLLREMVKLGFASRPPKGDDFYDDSSDEDDDKDPKTTKRLIIQQARVENSVGDIRVIYPSKTDLCFDTKEIKVERF